MLMLKKNNAIKKIIFVTVSQLQRFCNGCGRKSFVFDVLKKNCSNTVNAKQYYAG